MKSSTMTKTRKSIENDLRYSYAEPVNFEGFEFSFTSPKVPLKAILRNYHKFFLEVSNQKVFYFINKLLNHVKEEYPHDNVVIAAINAQYHAYSTLLPIKNQLQKSSSASSKKIIGQIDEILRNINAVVTTKRHGAYHDLNYGRNLTREVDTIRKSFKSYNCCFSNCAELKEELAEPATECMPPLFWG